MPQTWLLNMRPLPALLRTRAHTRRQARACSAGGQLGGGKLVGLAWGYGGISFGVVVGLAWGCGGISFGVMVGLALGLWWD